jgi:HEAT repeat protein
LKAIGPAAKSAVPELAKRLKSDSVKEQLVVIEMLPIFGASAKPAVSGLVSLLGEKKLDKDIEIATLDALGQIGPLEPSVIPEVVKKLGSTTGYIRIYAVKSLARMGPAAKPAADDLKKFGQSKDRTATIWAAAALARIGVDTSANVAIVLEAMQKSQPGPVRRAAMEAAEYLGPAGKPAVPILTELLKEKEAISKSDERSVRILAVTALGKMGELAKDVVPKLADFLKESDENLKRAVIVALGNIGPPASSTVGRLRDIARGDKNLSDEANEALAKIEPKAQ